MTAHDSKGQVNRRNYDVMIIGAGPGGYVAAIRAAQLGLTTAIVEEQHLGGICLNWGCIPTKALLRSAEIYSHLQHATEFGLEAPKVSFDIKKVVKRSRDIAKKLNGGVEHLLAKNKIDVYKARARLLGKGRLIIDGEGFSGEELSAKHIILATGARPRSIPGLEPDGELVWTSREAMVPEAIPESLLIIGAGAIGVEFASFYNAFGADVTITELMPEILPSEDAEIAAAARKQFEKLGIKVRTGASVTKLDRRSDHVIATLQSQGKTQEVRFDRVISAVGVVGNYEGLGLENTSVVVDGPFIEVDEWCRTSEAGVFAIGDLAGAPCLAHKASHEGVTCIEFIAGLEGIHPVDRTRVPGCTYSMPQVASVGLTEAQARESGHDIRVGRFPLQANGKAIALGETTGMVKTVFDAKSGELLGAHMVGAEVTELIQGYGIAQTLETTERELMHTIFPHPTLSESMHEATLDAYGQAIHY